MATAITAKHCLSYYDSFDGETYVIYALHKKPLISFMDAIATNKRYQHIQLIDC